MMISRMHIHGLSEISNAATSRRCVHTIYPSRPAISQFCCICVNSVLRSPENDHRIFRFQARYRVDRTLVNSLAISHEQRFNSVRRLLIPQACKGKKKKGVNFFYTLVRNKCIYTLYRYYPIQPIHTHIHTLYNFHILPLTDDVSAH